MAHAISGLPGMLPISEETVLAILRRDAKQEAVDQQYNSKTRTGRLIRQRQWAVGEDFQQRLLIFSGNDMRKKRRSGLLFRESQQRSLVCSEKAPPQTPVEGVLANINGIGTSTLLTITYVLAMCVN